MQLQLAEIKSSISSLRKGAQCWSLSCISSTYPLQTAVRELLCSQFCLAVKFKHSFILCSPPTSLCSRPSHILIPFVFVLLFSSWLNCILLCPENHQSSICKCLMMYTNANKPTDISELVFHPEEMKSTGCTGCEWLDLTPFSCWEKIHRISWAAETNYLSLTQCSAQQTLSLIWW